MPSILPSKRSRLVTMVAAGTLSVATIATAVAATLPSASAADIAGANAHLTTVTQQQDRGDSMSAAQRLIGFQRVRFGLGERQQENDVATAKAEASAAAAKAAARAAAAKASAVRAQLQRTVSTPSGSPEQIAQEMLGHFGWSNSQFSSLYPLWEHESGWNPCAENSGSGAYGIPQALPGAQMASAGADWQTNAATQIKWGLTYIQQRYGSPSAAWAHELANGWY